MGIVSRMPRGATPVVMRRLLPIGAAVFVVALGLSSPTSAAGEAGDSFTFWPVADTYVDASAPDTSFGASSYATVDASPTKQAFLKFSPDHLDGRLVTGVRLRMYQVDSSPHGGRVTKLTSNSWSESMTWATRPALGGSVLGTFGSVATGKWYEVALDPSAVTGDGTISFGIDSPSGDGAKWATRENSYVPQLIVDVAPVEGLTVDGLLPVAHARMGSSDPTYYSNVHRLARTAGGRLLAVHGRHSEGVQLAWRNPGGGWQTSTTGAVTDGLLLSGTGTGDWNASIAIVEEDGNESAWVVWSGPNIASTPKPIRMRRLTNLDAPGGPAVGPVTTVDAPSLGAARADIGFEESAGGARGVVTWLRKTGDTSYAQMTTWFTDLATATPAFHHTTTLFSTSSQSRAATLETDGSGTRLVIRNAGGRFQLFRHAVGDDLGTWRAGATGATASGSSFPAATILDSGATLVAAETDTTNHVVKVQRWSPDGSTTGVETTLNGYAQPTISSDGVNAWLVAVRASDGAVISRRIAGPSGAATSDTVEISAATAPAAAYPNALRRITEGRLRFIVRGARSGTSRSSVLSFQRPV